ncbi:cationic peroxidase 2-like [Silene latifolia]|uniref:cationic peroxidase 2-like n=1 Tax=Silene latifolia TaxID=37657 RepID=UPI003D781DB3
MMKFILGLVLVTLISECYGSIYHGYYIGKCGKYNVEEIIFNAVKTHFQRDPDTVSDLIRLQFHDCFVRGCDGSVLLHGENTEKTAHINVGLSGFRTVDDAKEAVEKVCPGVVSCADVLTIAARSAVFMAGGKWYGVETGRRDSLVSHRSEAIANIPKADIPVNQAIQLFASKGLSKEDFVYLMGGHTVGTAHCDTFKNRLYNFHNTGNRDMRIQPLNFLHFLKRTCPRDSRVDNQAFLDQTPKSEFKIDNGYYRQILHNKGILEIDDNLAFSPLTNGIVKQLAYTPGLFHDKFGPAMVKMGRINVLTGNQGEIRRLCRAVNH